MPVDSISQHQVVSELNEAAASGDYVAAFRRSAQAAAAARRSPEPAALLADLERFASEGAFARLLAFESIVELRDEKATAVLVDALSDSEPIVRRHAAWRLRSRPAAARGIGPLIGLLTDGGIDTMHAHRTLRRWATAERESITDHTVRALTDADGPAVRARLVDLLGALGGTGADERLAQVAGDPAEPTPARIAAVGALGTRRGRPFAAGLRHLAMLDDDLGAHAALALDQQTDAVQRVADAGRGDGLRIAQLALSGHLDGGLSRGGRGETGGVASLLVSLGQAFARRADVDHVVTIGRGTVTDALFGLTPFDDLPLSFGTIAFGDDARPAEHASGSWEHFPAIERGIRRALQLAGPVDVLHLRMADAGTLVGSEVAAALGIPICFSVAPDPHNVLQSLQARGEFDDAAFVELDEQSHVWFRARLIEQLARNADRLALFPRAKSRSFFELVDLRSTRDEGTHSEQRSAVVAEGIDIGLIRRAEEQCPHGPSTAEHRSTIVSDLAARVPAHRRHLPLLLSVGRLHPVKGMERVAAAWASDAGLHESCTLVIVGGDLEHPSVAEQTVLDAIDRTVPADDPCRDGLVLLGGRPHDSVAELLVATGRGEPGSWAGGGVYVDGALKEEFGLALIEALAAGLVVTAPSTGGPPSYIDHGDTGILVDPSADLSVAIRAAFELVDRRGRASRARALVAARYSIDTMASALVELYLSESAVV